MASGTTTTVSELNLLQCSQASPALRMAIGGMHGLFTIRHAAIKEIHDQQQRYHDCVV